MQCCKFVSVAIKLSQSLLYSLPELINSIEITIAIDIFGTIAIAIAIVKKISQLLLLLLLLIRSSLSIFFFLFGICRFWTSAVGIIGKNGVEVVKLSLKSTNMPINPKIRAWNVLLLLKNYCYCPFLALLLLLLTIAKGLPELLLLISNLLELLLLLLIEKFSIDQLCSLRYLRTHFKQVI